MKRKSVCSITIFALLLCGGNLSAESPARCKQFALQARHTWNVADASGLQSVERFMSGIVDQSFDLDCINSISFLGGIRFYRASDFLGILRRKACREVNKAVDRINRSVSGNLDAVEGLFGLEYEGGIRTHSSSPSPAAAYPQYDLNGDVAIGGRSQEKTDTKTLGNTLRDLFR